MAKYKACFEPQAWIHDYACPVDAEGDTEWDCSEFLHRRPTLRAAVDKECDEDGHFLDADDRFMHDENAPRWVRDWRGPFTITIFRNTTSAEKEAHA